MSPKGRCSVFCILCIGAVVSNPAMKHKQHNLPSIYSSPRLCVPEEEPTDANRNHHN